MFTFIHLFLRDEWLVLAHGRRVELKVGKVWPEESRWLVTVCSQEAERDGYSDFVVR